MAATPQERITTSASRTPAKTSFPTQSQRSDDMPSQTEIRQQITQQIINSLQQGIVPWKRPWSADKNCGRPTNVVTKKRYNGVNVLLLTLHNQNYFSHSKYFATYRQWQSIGGQVMARPSGVPKGEWGCKSHPLQADFENKDQRQRRRGRRQFLRDAAV